MERSGKELPQTPGVRYLTSFLYFIATRRFGCLILLDSCHSGEDDRLNGDGGDVGKGRRDGEGSHGEVSMIPSAVPTSS